MTQNISVEVALYPVRHIAKVDIAEAFNAAFADIDGIPDINIKKGVASISFTGEKEVSFNADEGYFDDLEDWLSVDNRMYQVVRLLKLYTGKDLEFDVSDVNADSAMELLSRMNDDLEGELIDADMDNHAA